MDKISRQSRWLIVDDEEAICFALNEKLKISGMESMTCSDSRRAQELIRSIRFDGVISDLNMPGLSGLDLLKDIRKNHPHAAFLLVTGTDDIRVGVEAMKQGADDYIVKPFNLDGVIASMERALQSKRLQQEVDNYRLKLEEVVDQRTKQLQAALKRIELTYDETLKALGAALDLRDNETAGHSRRVTEYCLHIAKLLGCSAEEMKDISRGAYLHDIGKIGIPDAILLKAGPLDQNERAIMETHSRIGYELVSRIAFLAKAAEMVLTHQERFDGTGYPYGLQGVEIPIGARCFAVADTLDAMTSDRPYRRALSFSEAQAEIERQAGRQFDPEVVKVFLSVDTDEWLEMRNNLGGTPDRARSL